jgi:hypothetical protein
MQQKLSLIWFKFKNEHLKYCVSFTQKFLKKKCFKCSIVKHIYLPLQYSKRRNNNDSIF